MIISQEEIIKKLNEKKAVLSCHRCGQNNFSVLDGISNISLQQDVNLNMLQIGGPAVPVFLVACNNCGAITPHALGALGLLPKSKATTEIVND